MKIIKSLCALGFLLGLGSALLLSIFWWTRSQLPYNESGRYRNGIVIWQEQAVTAYAVLALAFILMTTLLAVLCYWKKKPA